MTPLFMLTQDKANNAKETHGECNGKVNGDTRHFTEIRNDTVSSNCITPQVYK
jgi:hypothetical protein